MEIKKTYIFTDIDEDTAQGLLNLLESTLDATLVKMAVHNTDKLIRFRDILAASVYVEEK